MPGMEWLLAAPQFEQTIIGKDGISVTHSGSRTSDVCSPTSYGSLRPATRPIKSCDVSHARVVSELTCTYLNDPLAIKAMPWLPKPLKDLVKELKK